VRRATAETGTMERNARTASFLALDGAEQYPVQPMMALLCAVAFTEGLDNALFPAITKALERTVNFDISTLGSMGMIQLVFQAAGGPMWGILASRAILTRKQILMIGTFFQGLATLVMWMFVSNYYMLLALRAVNGVCLASLRPIANSVVADRFDDTARGKYFGQIMMSMAAGSAMAGIGATLISEEVIIPGTTFWGWKLSFVVVGLFSMSLTPLIHFYFQAPPVKVPEAKANEGGGVAREMRTLVKLFSRMSFAVLAFQGCFGLIPWRAFDFRTFFFETAGLDKTEAATINLFGGIGNALGALLGGFVGDGLNRCWPLHGRVLAAEISVYGGIPIAFFTFMWYPAESTAFLWYFCLTAALGLVATWTPAACNNPVLCSLAQDNERSLVLAWQGALEGAIGASGGFIFTWLLANVFNYDPACNLPENKDRPDCQNVEAAGKALFWTSCVPWIVCGAMYSCLHYTYPRDIKKIEEERESEGLAGLESELVVR